jgi:hypothetical protein
MAQALSMNRRAETRSDRPGRAKLDRMSSPSDQQPEFRIKPLPLVLMGAGMAVFWGAVMLGADALGLIDGEPGVRNPWPTIALAIVMGVVFPLLWRRQMIRRSRR